MADTRVRAPKPVLVVAGMIALILALSALAGAQSAAQTKTTALVKNLTGDWIGTCIQCTEGEDPENSYFHAKLEKTGENTFVGKFTYYRLDRKTSEPLNIGETTLAATVQPDGTIVNEMVGKGQILIGGEQKRQEYEVAEVLTVTPCGTLAGKIDGKISVSGMPLGLGKNGKIRNGSSAWSVEKGVLTIDQSIKAGFKVLLMSKSYTTKAHFEARRGTDVVSLMRKDLASKPALAKGPGS